MTAKLKAKELVNKFYKKGKYMEHSILCALILVDKILQVIKQNSLNLDKKYWKEVRQEIIKL